MGYRILAGLGRIAISLVFVVLGVSAMFHWDMAKGDLTTALGNWEMYAGHIDGASVVFQLDKYTTSLSFDSLYMENLIVTTISAGTGYIYFA